MGSWTENQADGVTRHPASVTISVILSPMLSVITGIVTVSGAIVILQHPVTIRDEGGR